MKKTIVRKLAIYMAFFQLFSVSAKADNKYVLVDNTNENNPIYQIYDTNTKEYSNISIFDDKNVSTNQYGASQNSFGEVYFYRLFNNDYIQEEMAKQLSKVKFSSLEHAQLFYKYYFATLAKNGCGFAAATNYIFQLFEGKEQEFYEKFKFPMYEINYQSIDYNYEIFMLKFFNYYINKNNLFDDIEKTINGKIYEHIINEYNEKIKYTIDIKDKLRAHYKSKYGNWTLEDIEKLKEENEVYSKEIDEYNKIIELYQEKLKSIPDRKYGIPLIPSFGNLDKFLKQYGIKIKTSIENDSKSPNINDIIACENYELTEYGFKYSYEEAPHYMYIVDILEDNKMVVSSWGRKYILTNEKDFLNTRVKIKTLN